MVLTPGRKWCSEVGKRRRKILSTHKVGYGTSTPLSVASLQEIAAPGTSKFACVHSGLILVERSFSPEAVPHLRLSGLHFSSLSLLLVLLWMRTLLVRATVFKLGTELKHSYVLVTGFV